MSFALNRSIATLAHHIGCAELSAKCDSVRMAAEENDLFCGETPCGNDAAQTDGAVADNRDAFARTDSRRHGRMMPRPHHV